jgi:hypothetical protein
VGWTPNCLQSTVLLSTVLLSTVLQSFQMAKELHFI